MGGGERVDDWRCWRAAVRARLAGARAELIWQLIDLDEATLSREPIVGDWTSKDILAHVAAWDDLYQERIELVLAGRQKEIEPLDADSLNARLYEERRAWSVEASLQAALAARRSFLDTLARADDEALARAYELPPGERSIPLWTELRVEHDREHAVQVRRWRGQTHPPESQGPTTILVAALRAARKELLTAVALVPAGVRAGLDLRGETLQEALRRLGNDEAQIIDVPHNPLPDNALAAPWDEVWHDLHRVHELLLRRLRVPEIERSLGRKNVYQRYAAAGRRDRELAARVRASLA